MYPPDAMGFDIVDARSTNGKNVYSAHDDVLYLPTEVEPSMPDVARVLLSIVLLISVARSQEPTPIHPLKICVRTDTDTDDVFYRSSGFTRFRDTSTVTHQLVL